MLTLQAVGAAPLQLLEAIRQFDPKIRFFQASSAEMFRHATLGAAGRGHPAVPAHPVRSGQGVRALDDGELPRYVWAVRLQRHPVQHESALRSREFVTRKISDSVAKIRLGKLECLRLGRLDSRRDWGYAPDYVEAMVRMMQVRVAWDLRAATGRTASIRDFAAIAFRVAGIGNRISGTGAG